MSEWTRSRWIPLRVALLVLATGSSAGAQAVPAAGALTWNAAADSAILSHVKAPPGFDVTVFARPPVAMYPTCLTAAPDGAVYVCVDGNLSLSTDKGRGRIVRLVDIDADGHADRYSVFAEMDSPRGVVSDGRSLFVMHPPSLTAYRDTTGDGVADVSEDLVRGLGFDLDFRGADHATNGITLGIDGWIYVAVGDYGFRRATGKDGTTIAHRGGAVVRVRPDGTGLEIYAVGTRNIYDVAVDPLLNVFSRDNTNDGDGWDTRLHFIAAGAHMGYPTFYKNFADEHMPSLAEYGAGAGTGAVWVHDPAFPGAFGNTLYTGDWTLNKVFRHSLTPKGASFDAGQEEFLTVPHPSDMAIDGAGHMYVASLAGGQFTYAGDTVGYVLRVSPSGTAAAGTDRIASLSMVQLTERLLSANGEHRLQAQREMLRRRRDPATITALERAVLDTARPPAVRAAAMFTLVQLSGERAQRTITRSASDPAIRAVALRALTDDRRLAKSVTPSIVEPFLADADPAVQRAAIASLVRLRSVRSADAIAPLTASSDPALAHLAVNALVSLDGRAAALRALDRAPTAVRLGVLRALHQMHDSATVAALIARVDRPQEASVRMALVAALARLYHTEAPWAGDWWGTQPAFAGPYFAPVPWAESRRIAPVLRRTLLASRGEETETLTDVLIRNRVMPQGVKELVVALNRDPEGQLRTDVLSGFIGASRVEAPAIPALEILDRRDQPLHAAVATLLAAESPLDPSALNLASRAVLDTTLRGDVRGALLTSIARLPGDAGRTAAAELAARVNPFGGNAAEVEAAWRRFVGDRRRTTELDYFIDLARTGRPEQRTLAYSVLVQSVRSARTAAAIRDKVTPVLAAAWTDPASAASLVQAITIMRLESQYAEPLAAYRRSPPPEAW